MSRTCVQIVKGLPNVLMWWSFESRHSVYTGPKRPHEGEGPLGSVPGGKERRGGV